MAKNIFELNDNEVSNLSDEEVSRLFEEWIEEQEANTQKWKERRAKEKADLKAIAASIADGKYAGLTSDGVAWRLQFPYINDQDYYVEG